MYKDKLEKAKSLIDNLEYIKAENILRELYLSYPKNVYVAFELGKVYFFQNNFIESRKLFFQTKNCNELAVHSMLFLAKITIKEKKYHEAIDMLLLVKEKYGNKLEVLYELSKLYSFLQDDKNLLSIYNEIIEIDRNNVDIKFKKFELLHKKSETIEECLFYAEELIKNQNIGIKQKNSLLNFIEYSTKKSLLKSLPQNLSVAVTGACNIDCLMCTAYKSSWVLSEKTKNEIIELLPYLYNIKWLGGEPLLYKDLSRLMDIANENNVQQHLVTNGLLLNENIIRKIIDYNVFMQVSVDAPNKSLYEYIRKGASFKNLLDNFELFNKFTKNKEYHFCLNCVILDENYKILDDIIKFAAKFNFTDVSFIMKDNTNCYSKEILSYISQNLNLYYGIANEYDIKINSVLFEVLKKTNIKKINTEKVNNSLFCIIPWLSFCIIPPGIVTADCACSLRSLGLQEGKSIFEVWNDDNFVSYRKQIITNNFDKVCKKHCIDGVYSQHYRLTIDLRND